MQKNHAFTLIELLVTIAIIAILSSLALPKYKNYQAKAKFAEVISAASALKSEMELCFADKGVKKIIFNLKTTGKLCSNDKTKASLRQGFGYFIKSPKDYQTKYINRIETIAGCILAVANDIDGLQGAHYSICAIEINNNKVEWAQVGQCDNYSQGSKKELSDFCKIFGFNQSVYGPNCVDVDLC